MNNTEVEQKPKKMNENLRDLMRGDLPDHYVYEFTAVGYLDNEQFDKGRVPAGFIRKLKTLWSQGIVIASLGHHTCPFCENATSSSEKILMDDVGKVTYIFPEMIFHYIKKHKYLPPEAFIKFIMGK